MARTRRRKPLRIRKEKLIAYFFREWHDKKVAATFEYTTQITGEIPAQANNEIRNAINHITRVYSSTNIQVLKKNFFQARWHMYIAECDCLLISIIRIQEMTQEFLEDAERKHCTLKNEIHEALRDILEARQELKIRMKREPFQYGVYISRDLAILLDKCLKIQSEIRDVINESPE